MFTLRSKTKKIPGETLIEVLAAVVLFVLIITTTFSLLNRATSTNVDVRNRVTALSIARDGIEAIRNVRDTNWLKYSGNKDANWLCIDTSSTDCPTKIDTDGEDFYTIEFSDTDKRYYLSNPIGTEARLNITPGSLSDGAAKFQLYKTPIGRYSHASSGNTTTIFYRQLELIAISNDPCGVGDCTQRYLDVTARVQWVEDGQVQKLNLETRLFNFFNRDQY
jgi:type II secretory pathway pseudopilin PulG